MGLYAKIVQSPEYRDNKIGTALAMLPRMLGPHAEPFDLQFTGPDGEEHRAAHLITVSNGPYQLHDKEGFGSRRRVDSGLLGILALRFESSGDVARFLQMPPGRQHRFHGWMEWTAETFQVRSSHPVEIGIDGEAVLLDPPLDFRIVPSAIRVRIPLRAPGYSPAAAAPPAGWPILGALLKTAAGRPVAIEA